MTMLAPPPADSKKFSLPKAPNAIINGVIGRDDSDAKGRKYIRPSDELVLTSTTHILDCTGDSSWQKSYYIKLAGILGATRHDDIAAISAEDLSDKGRKDFEKSHGGRSPSDDEATALARREFISTEIRLLSEIKADMGSYQHHVLEALVLWAAGSEIEMPDIPEHLIGIEVDEEIIDPIVHDVISDGLLQFFADFPDAIVEMAEATVANPELGTAGTLDLIVYFPSGITIDGVIYYRLLIDLKTGKWLKPDMQTQLSAYRHSTEIWLDYLGNTAPMPAVDGAAILHLRRDYDAGYKLIIVDAGIDQFGEFCDRVARFNKAQNQPKKFGSIAYPPLPDGSQPLPMIEDITDLSRYQKKLRAAGLRRLEDLTQFSASDVQALPGVGPKAIEACTACLGNYGLSFSGGAA